jgi:hypothetical protein
MKRVCYFCIFLLCIGACSPKNVDRRPLELTELSQSLSDSVASISSDLPAFFVVAFENFIEISWETNSEDSIILYEIEKNVDTMGFKTFTKVEPFGSDEGARYVEIDGDLIYNQPLKYRLKITRENDLVYSEIKEVFLEKPVEKIEVVTHPNNNKKYIEFFGSSPNYAVLDLYHAGGKLVIHQTIEVKKGYNKIEIPLKYQTYGVYYMQFKGPLKRLFIKLCEEAN